MVFAAQVDTTTSSIAPKIVGDPLPTWVVLAAGLALFVVVVAGGMLLRRRAREPQA
jgi:hypothetical protein